MWPGSVGTRVRLAALIPAALLALWFVLLRPPFMGGDTTYLIVSGESMQPTLFTNDLVIIKRTGTYEVGDILAFQVGDGLVIHRAIAGNQDAGFVMQGDNRAGPDPWNPTADSVIGRYVIDIPLAGHVVGWLGQPVVFGGAVAGLSLLGGGFGKRRAMRSGRRKQMHSNGVSDGHSPPRRQSWRGAPRMFAVLVGAAVVGGLFASLAGLALWHPTERTEYVEDVAYEHSSTFDYRADVEPSTLYPDGRLSPVELDDGTIGLAQPIYTVLARSMTVDYEYVLNTDLPPAVAGEISADLVIRAGEGWTRTESLMSPRPFEGPTASGSFTIDFAAIRRIVTLIQEETEFTPPNYTLTVQPRVSLQGSLGAHPIEETYTSAFEIGYTRTTVTPPTALRLSEPVSAGDDVTVVNQMSVLGLELSVATWRAFGLAGALVSLAIAAGVAAVTFLGLGQREEERIRARYRGMLVPVETNGSTPAATSIHVASIADLARLAQRDGGIIFEEVGPTTHRYFVRDGQDTYDYTVAVNRRDLTPPASIPATETGT